MDYDHDLQEVVQEAVDAGLINEKSAGHGVAQQCIHNGYDSLTDAQKFAFDKHVAPYLEKLSEQREVQRRIKGMHD